MQSSTSSGSRRISRMSDGWIDCPECEGYGLLEITRGGVNGHGPWVDTFSRKCPECDGDGEVPVRE